MTMPESSAGYNRALLQLPPPFFLTLPFPSLPEGSQGGWHHLHSLVVHQFHLVVHSYKAGEEALSFNKALKDNLKKKKKKFYFLLTWPVCSVSSLLMRYIKKNLKQAHDVGINAENVTSLPHLS